MTIPKAPSEGEETFALHCKLKNLTPLREVRLIPGRKWAVDFYFRERDIAVEIEGGTAYGRSRHSQGTGFENDARKYNALALAGVKVLRFTTAMVKSGEAIDTVLEALK
jgi:very-short-patch-repair endonuclease